MRLIPLGVLVVAMTGCPRWRSEPGVQLDAGAPAPPVAAQAVPESAAPPVVPPPPQPIAGLFAAGRVGGIGPQGRASSIVPLRLHAGRLHEAPAIPGAHAAVDGDAYCVAAGTEVSLHRPFSPGQAPQRAKASCPATSLHLIGNHCFVGCALRVDVVGFGMKAPATVTLHDDPDPVAQDMKRQGFGKAVDFFLRTPTRLWAVDDIVIPKWAYLFERRPQAKFRERVGLPRPLRGTLLGGAVDGESLYVLEASHHMMGSGSSVSRLDLKGSELEFTPVVTESRATSPGGAAPREQAIVGTATTPLTGVAVVGGHLALAAQGRGIILVGRDGATPRMVPTEGPCTHLVEVPGGVLALIGEKLVVKMRWDGAAQTLVVESRHPMQQALMGLAR